MPYNRITAVEMKNTIKNMLKSLRRAKKCLYGAITGRVLEKCSLAGLFLLIFVGCSTVRYVPVETVREVRVRDSVYVRDTVVRVELEKARISDFVDPSDTLVLETDLARSTAFLDTVMNVLRGTIENTKPYVEKPVPVQHRIEYRDTFYVRQVPYPVEVIKEKRYVPWIVRVLAWLGGISIAAAVIYILRKLRIL